MVRRLLSFAALCTAVVLGGCAHPISLTPDVAGLAGTGPSPRIDRPVVLVITEAQLAQEVISPGGGGDKVSYKPYKDLQTGLYVALGEVFTRVSLASSPTDPRIGNDPATVIVTPTISTTSFSPSLFTWPPTIFTVTLEMGFRAPGKPDALASVRVQGEGRAEFDEFKGNFSLSAQRASQDALARLVKAMQAQSDALKRWTVASFRGRAPDPLTDH